MSFPSIGSFQTSCPAFNFPFLETSTPAMPTCPAIFFPQEDHSAPRNNVALLAACVSGVAIVALLAWRLIKPAEYLTNKQQIKTNHINFCLTEVKKINECNQEILTKLSQLADPTLEDLAETRDLAMETLIAEAQKNAKNASRIAKLSETAVQILIERVGSPRTEADKDSTQILPEIIRMNSELQKQSQEAIAAANEASEFLDTLNEARRTDKALSAIARHLGRIQTLLKNASAAHIQAKGELQQAKARIGIMDPQGKGVSTITYLNFAKMGASSVVECWKEARIPLNAAEEILRENPHLGESEAMRTMIQEIHRLNRSFQELADSATHVSTEVSSLTTRIESMSSK